MVAIFAGSKIVVRDDLYASRTSREKIEAKRILVCYTEDMRKILILLSSGGFTNTD
jgi:hypothetical protein